MGFLCFRSHEPSLTTQTKMADAYEVVKGSLKLKGVADGGIKKKKKKKKNKALEAAKMSKLPEQETRNSSGDDHERSEKDNELDNRTQAQKTFDRTQEQRANERILKKAGKTHRQRVEKFNEYLDDLTEHYDIPKVSWTK
ncbi:hypothetical protein QZH41_018143 [Actinostola sp. cb2023]|nr:hypothetical protein QZH41_018143 [Actinostola sp. cb2023]